MNEILLSAVSPMLQYIGVRLNIPYGFSIARGKIYSIIGPNGCGKTTLSLIVERGWNIATNKIIGDKKSLHIKRIEFSDIHSLTGCSESYYQQRFESTMNDAIPTVEELISKKFNREKWLELCEKLSLYDILHKRINFLSSGELRKFLILNLFTDVPDILILDNPYIGLDEKSRVLLDQLIVSIAESGTAVMLLLCNPDDIPQYTSEIIPMSNMSIAETISVERGTPIEEYRKKVEYLFDKYIDINSLPEFVPQNIDYDIAFELSNCNVGYTSTVILRNLSWKVVAGEKWALLGPNGSGKSTLLSLIYADNPQGYKNDITLFDVRRGSGESIWDIKRRIAYISPEMHLYFNESVDVVRVITSGLHDHVGCYRRPTLQEEELALEWLKALGIDHLAHRRFPTLSSGEQRLVLLARTFIRDASLIILDEPLHGLDSVHKRLISEIIESRVRHKGISLVYVTHYRNEIPQCVDHIFTLTKQ